MDAPWLLGSNRGEADTRALVWQPSLATKPGSRPLLGIRSLLEAHVTTVATCDLFAIHRQHGQVELWFFERTECVREGPFQIVFERKELFQIGQFCKGLGNSSCKLAVKMKEEKISGSDHAKNAPSFLLCKGKLTYYQYSNVLQLSAC